MGIIDELNQVIYNLPFHKQPVSRNEIAHFCEHDGIYIHFTQARTTWHALAPCALKPWWLFLKPLRKSVSTKNVSTINTPAQLNDTEKKEEKIKITKTDSEVIENA